jgi:MFS family permease
MTDHPPSALDQKKLGPITLAPHITPRQVFSFIMLGVTMASLGGFVQLMMPYVLTDQLGLPRDVHGRVTGTVQVVQQTASIIFISIFGALADRHGRKRFLLLAAAGLILTALWFPFITTLPILLAAIFFMGVAQTAFTAGGATSVIDYPDNNSRGKYIALMIVTQGTLAGLFAGKIGMNIPGWLEAAQFAPATGNRLAFWFVAALTMVGAGFAWWGITYDRQRSDDKVRAGVVAEVRGAFANLAGVFRHAKINRKFRLILFIACVVRSDFLIVAAFLSLWVVSIAAEQGIEPTMARAQVGDFFFFLHMAGVVMPVVAGFLIDRAPRMKFLMVALGFAAVAYSSTMLVSDVFGAAAWIVVGLIGLSEGMIVVSAQSVLGEEAPAHLRGSSIGVFTLAGMLGVLLVSLAGGFAFDKIHHSAPFVLVGALNLTALVFAIRFSRTGDG